MATKPKDLKTQEDIQVLLKDPTVRHDGEYNIYPDAAKYLLDLHNPKNRKILSTRVKFHADNLRTNRFLLINNGIGIDWDGMLLDGQHRLQAVIDTGLPIPVFLHVGLNPEGRKVIDTGRARRLGDTIEALGIGEGKHATGVAAMVRLLYRYKFNLMRPGTGGATLPQDVLLEFADEVGIEKCHEAVRRGDEVRKCTSGANASALSAMWFMVNDLDPFEAANFMDRIAQIQPTTLGDPEAKYRSICANGLERKIRRRAEEHLVLLIKAWNARVTQSYAGKNHWELKYRKDEKVPTPIDPKQWAQQVEEKRYAEVSDDA